MDMDLCRAIERVDLSAVKQILETGPGEVLRRHWDTAPGSYWTPLHHSVHSCSRVSSSSSSSSSSFHKNNNKEEKGHLQKRTLALLRTQELRALDILFRILDSPYGKDATLLQTRELYTPLHLCCRLLVPDQALTAVAKGNPYAISLQDLDGDTPLHAAVRYKNSDLAIHTLIQLAFGFGFETKYNVRRGIRNCDDWDWDWDWDVDNHNHNPLAMMDYIDGDLPLHIAVSHEASAPIVQLLLDAYPLAISTCNAYHQTPLHLACICARFDLVQTLLTSHAATGILLHLLLMKDQFGFKPLDILWKIHLQAVTRFHDVVMIDSIDPIESVQCIANVIRIAAYSHNPCTSWNRIASSVPSSSSSSSSSSSLHQEEDNFLLIQEALKLGHEVVPLPFIQLLLREHPQVLNMTDSLGRTLLHLVLIMNIHTQSNTNFLHNGEIFSDPCFDMLHNRDHDMDEKRDLTEDWDESNKAPDTIVNPSTSDQWLKTILHGYPEAASISDALGYLPLHYASQFSASWDHGGTKDLILAYPEALSVPIPTCKLYPFMIAASADNLELTYHLLRNAPHTLDHHALSHQVVAAEQVNMASSRRSAYSPTTVTFDVFTLPCFFDKCKNSRKSPTLKKRKRLFSSSSSKVHK